MVSFTNHETISVKRFLYVPQEKYALSKYVVPVKTVYTTTSGAKVNMNGVDMLELHYGSGSRHGTHKIKYIVTSI